MDNRVVTVDLGERAYDIFIGAGLLARLADYIPQDMKGRKAFIIFDESVQSYAGDIRETLKAAHVHSAHIYALTSGESTKCFENVEKITSWLLENHADRQSVVFSVGGGVTGDLAGFCASITLRGLPVVQIPTTLLSQVDSSVGGKTGINTAQGKNLIGSFYQPSAVIIDTDTLKTLPEREIRAGYAEIAKYGLINNPGFFEWLEEKGDEVCALDQEELLYAIETSVQAKADIVKADEKEETDTRALLNLGHTFGHALEAAAGYNGTLLHGEAVSIGIVMAFELSCRMDICARADVDRVKGHFEKLGLPIYASMIKPTLNVQSVELLAHMHHDKKAARGTINFVITNGIGEAFMSADVDEAMVQSVLAESLGQTEETSRATTPEGESKKALSEATAKEFKLKGVKGLWKSAFSSQS